MEHVPVLLAETVRALVGDPSGLYVDGTFGRGGHARRLLAALDADARLIALDADEEAFRSASELAEHDSRVQAVRDRFSQLDHYVPGGEGAAGVMLDVGLSSPQLDAAERGFSFQPRRPSRHAHGPAPGHHSRRLAGPSKRTRHRRRIASLRR